MGKTSDIQTIVELGLGRRRLRSRSAARFIKEKRRGTNLLALLALVALSVGALGGYSAGTGKLRPHEAHAQELPGVTTAGQLLSVHETGCRNKAPTVSLWGHEAMVRNLESPCKGARVLAVVNLSLRDNDVPAEKVAARLDAAAGGSLRIDEEEVQALASALVGHIKRTGEGDPADYVGWLSAKDPYVRLAGCDVIAALEDRGVAAPEEALGVIQDDRLLRNYGHGKDIVRSIRGR